MPTIVKNSPTFNSVAPFNGLTLFNEAISDDGAGEEMPNPLTWNVASPVGDIDWSAFTVAVDAAGINRSNRAGATLVSPSYCVMADHAPGDSTGHTWMTSAGVEVTRTIGSTLNTDYWQLGGDLRLAKLSAPINSITPMPLLADCSRVAGRNGLAIEMDRHLNRFVIQPTLDNDEYDATISRNNGTDGLESGDSGKPFVILIDGVPVMVITAMFSASPSGPPFLGIGPNASHYIDEINAILDADGEELTLWDVQTSGGGTIYPHLSSSFAPTRTPIHFMGV